MFFIGTLSQTLTLRAAFASSTYLLSQIPGPGRSSDDDLLIPLIPFSRGYIRASGLSIAARLPCQPTPARHLMTCLNPPNPLFKGAHQGLRAFHRHTAALPANSGPASDDALLLCMTTSVRHNWRLLPDTIASERHVQREKPNNLKLAQQTKTLIHNKLVDKAKARLPTFSHNLHLVAHCILLTLNNIHQITTCRLFEKKTSVSSYPNDPQRRQQTAGNSVKAYNHVNGAATRLPP